MTEDEAKTKWCPYARVIQLHPFSGQEGAVGNRWADDEARHPDDESGIELGSRCIGSACMAFRETRMEDDPAHEGRVFAYCGLAGKP